MDRRDYIGDFEDFLQEHADQHKLYPSDKLWAGIQQSLHPKPKWTYLYVAMIFLGLGIAGKIHDRTLTKELLLSTPIATKLPTRTIAPVSIEPRTSSNPQKQMAKVIPMKPILEEEIVEDKRLAIEPNTVKTNNKETSLKEVIILPEVPQNEPLTEEGIVQGTMQIASMQRISTKNKHPFEAVEVSSISEEIKKLPKSNALKMGWQFYISPTVSYRKLSGKGLPYYTNAGSNLNSVFPTANVEHSVTHKPALGFELGGAITYALSNAIRFKAGLQFNVNRYEVQAFHSVPEVAPMTNNNSGAGSINVVSTFRNYNGFSKTWLKNQHIMMSIPIGIEASLFGNDKVRFTIAGTLQPTYVVNNQAYMISTNMRNYAKAPALYKDFNVAAGAEAFISIKGKSLRYNVGPQFRYQLFSSYKKPYPINEFLTDYGLKLSIGR